MSVTDTTGMGAFLQPDGSVLVGRDCTGVAIKHVCGITIKIEPGSIVTAEIDIAITPETIKAHPMLSLPSLQKAAQAHGLNLAPRSFATYNDLATGEVRHIEITDGLTVQK